MKNFLKVKDTPLSEILKMPEQDKITLLEELIKYHNRKYFIDNAPEITDEYFDQITVTLKEIKPDSPALYELIGDIGEVEHPIPMLSLDKKYTYTDIKKWVEEIDDLNYIIEPKYDGMAARYQNNTLSTRGNGYFGEDISNRLHQLHLIGELPTDPHISAYGEVIIPLSYFNANLASAYRNPRNAVIGIVKAKVIKAEGIKALRDGGVHFVLHDQGKKLKVSKDDLTNEEQWVTLLEEMFHSDYPLDGIVIKATDPVIKEKLGRTAHHNKWEVAYKSPAERKTTTVLEIKDQVGRTGRITSVAVIEPIDLSGATVRNVTLHNYQYIKASGIDIGSLVEVCRSGEVIPFITRVFPADKTQIKRIAKDSNLKKGYKVPSKCPACKHKLYENNKYLECRNPDCPAQLSQSIEYFFKTLGAEELGLKTIEKFISEFKLKSIMDFYKLNFEKISELEGFGTKSAQKIQTNIEHTLNESITAPKLLQAIGIKEIGPATSNWIIREFGFDNLPTLTIEDIQTVKGIGPKKAEHFIREIKEKWPIISALKDLGLKFKKIKTGTKLGGKSFAITGKKAHYSRDELIKMIIENGGEYKSAITKGLTYLIAGEDAGSKLDKAESLSVEVISEDDFLKLIEKSF